MGSRNPEAFGLPLRGRTAFVVGGAHRLGRAIALGLARGGADVALTYHRSAAAAGRTTADIRRIGRRCIAVRADAASETEVDAAVRAALDTMTRIDILVANAGAFRRTPARSLSPADWEELFRTNFLTLFVPLSRLASELRRRRGCVIALADVAAIRPWREYAPYCASKAAVAALCRQAAVELAPRVRVNAIAPGPVLFPRNYPKEARRREIARTLLRRQGRPQNVADAAVFLAANDYVTGVVLPVDGGRLLGSGHWQGYE